MTNMQNDENRGRQKPSVPTKERTADNERHLSRRDGCDSATV
jgi:hypothetical protein